MAFSITGSLYNANLSVVGTNNVTVSTAPFVSTAFTTSRIVALFSAAGGFKGVGYVRRFLSTSSLELERPIYDPANGNIATQVVGDQLLVSKNALESVTAGFAVSGKTITITDACSFGTSAAFNTVCFHDIDYNIVTSQQINVQGGVVVFGKLNDYATNQISGGVDIFSTMTSGSSPFSTTSSRSIALIYGGIWDCLNSPNYFQLGGNTGIFNSIECRQDLVGGGDPNRVKLINSNLNTAATNAILCRIGAVAVIGGRFKINNGSAAPIAVFGNDSAGNFSVREVPGKRMIYSDNGTNRALTRSNTAVSLYYDFTNFITADSRAVTGAGATLPPNPNGRNRFYFQDTYTNIQPQSAAIIKNSAGATLETTTVTNTTWSPIVHHRTCIGATITVESTSWTYGIKQYGFAPIGGTITQSLYSLGVVGNADNVEFGGLVNQLADTNVTLSETAAVAKLASSFVVNTAFNKIILTSSSTLDDLYDAMKAWSTRPVAAQLEYPTISTQPVVANGDTLVTNMTIDGIEFLSAGTKFKKIQSTAFIANGAITNLSVIGEVFQSSPSNLSDASITGGISYDTSTAVTISLINSKISTVRNDGTGVITITRDATSSITDYSDPEINFLDSTISAVGITSATIYQTAGQRDANTNAGATFTTTLDFKYGAVLNGVTMSGTVYLRVLVGSTTLLAEINLAIGDNVLDMGIQGQLSTISSKIDTKPTLPQIEASTVLAKEATVATRATQASVDAIPTNPVLTTDSRLGNLDATISSRLATSAYVAPTNPDLSALATTAQLTAARDAINANVDQIPTNPLLSNDARLLALNKLDEPISSRLASDEYVIPPDVSQLATTAQLTAARDAINANVDAIPTVTPPTAEQIAVAVEAALLNDLDGQALLDAIVSNIGNQNIDQIALVAAIRADMERVGGKIDSIPTVTQIKSYLDVVNNGVKKSSLIIPHTTNLP